MSSRFNWETEEELLWQEQRKGGRRSRRPSKRFLLSAIVILAIVSGGVALSLRQIERNASEVSAAVTDEILASQRVWQYAIGDEDAELFATVLSGSLPSWLKAQYELFDNGLLLDRWTLGLAPVGEAQVTDINVSPDPI